MHISDLYTHLINESIPHWLWVHFQEDYVKVTFLPMETNHT